jgi:hypothetical protein
MVPCRLACTIVHVSVYGPTAAPALPKTSVTVTGSSVPAFESVSACHAACGMGRFENGVAFSAKYPLYS